MPSALLNNAGFLFVHKMDIIFVIFSIMLSIYYVVNIIQIKVPIHDAAVYLLNAKSWLTNSPLYENFRPQLLSWIIAAYMDRNW